MKLNSDDPAVLILRTIVVTTVVIACVALPALFLLTPTDFFAVVTQPSTLLDVLVRLVSTSVPCGLIGGTLGGLIAWWARRRLEAHPPYVRASWGLVSGGVLGILLPTLFLAASLVPDSPTTEWPSGMLILPAIGGIAGAGSGALVFTRYLGAHSIRGESAFMLEEPDNK